MPKYQVIVTRDVTVSGVVDVIADDPEDAEEKALAAYRRGALQGVMELDDCVNTRPYITGCEEVESA